jgi:hypothetical protein
MKLEFGVQSTSATDNRIASFEADTTFRHAVPVSEPACQSPNSWPLLTSVLCCPCCGASSACVSFAPSSQASSPDLVLLPGLPVRQASAVSQHEHKLPSPAPPPVHVPTLDLLVLLHARASAVTTLAMAPAMRQAALCFQVQALLLPRVRAAAALGAAPAPEAALVVRTPVRHA